MGQAGFRAFHFVADSVRTVRVISRHGRSVRASWFNASPSRKATGSFLRPTPGARVFRVDGDEVSAQVIAGTGGLVWEGESVEPVRARRY